MTLMKLLVFMWLLFAVVALAAAHYNIAGLDALIAYLLWRLYRCETKR